MNEEIKGLQSIKNLIVKRGYGICIIIAVLLVMAASIVRYKSGDINYYNSDATWHTLLTIKAYDEIPISQHLFLPIVTLGDAQGIPWGLTIQDTQGNFYYTSFSAAGYFLPWLFFKIFHLPVCEQSLYIFNSILFAISAVLWAVFLKWIFQKNYVTILGTMLYVFSPELFHGMGISYWHQSILQVTLLAQIMAYYRYKKVGTKGSCYVFYALTFINPYIEWTGYVANAGFVLAEMIEAKKENMSRTWKRILGIGILTVGSFVAFVEHYFLRLNEIKFWEMFLTRFFARGITTTELSSVFGGYFKSFAYIWIVLLILIIWNIWKYKKIEISHGMVMMLLAFPLLENVIMKQHAVLYSYDRMKGSWILVLLCCELIDKLSDDYKKNKLKYSALILTVVMACLLNIRSYEKSSTYIWKADYRTDNVTLANYINDNYSNSILAIDGVATRGYVNLLFGRGVWEWADIDALKEVARGRGIPYVIWLTVDNVDEWNMYDLGKAVVFDVTNESVWSIEISDNKILDSRF